MSPQRWRWWLGGLGGIVAILLVAELALRLAAQHETRVRTQRHPTLARRLVQNQQVSLAMTPEMLFAPVAQSVAPLADRGDDAKPPRWTPYGQLSLADLVPNYRPEGRDLAVKRIVVLGDSVLTGEVGVRLASAIQQQLAPAAVEVLNLSLPGAWSPTLDFLAQRFLPELAPDVVLVYTGRNDLVWGSAWSRAVIAHGLGLPMSYAVGISPLPAVAWALATPWEPWQIPAQRRWIEQSAVGRSVSHLWSVQRAAWAAGAETVFSTYGSPDDAQLSADDRDFYDSEVRLFWPMLGDFVRYQQMLARWNAAVVDLARASGSGLADTATQVRGGRQMYYDMCHVSPGASDRLVAVLASAVAAKLAARPVLVRQLPSAVAPTFVWQPPAAPPPQQTPPGGRCETGPCPAGTCFVPAGIYPYGYAPEVLEQALTAANERYGFARLHEWYGDDGPANSVQISAFCIDRTELSVETQQRCIAAGACPPMAKIGSDDSPAVLPTWLEAEALCRWRGARLPTDAEWEAAARGPDGRRFPWGERWSGSEANYCGSECAWGLAADPSDGTVGLAKSGHFVTGVSPFGLVDMAGNGWEFVADCFLNSIHDQLQPGVKDPIAQQWDTCRHTIRGGSYASLPLFLEKRTPEGSADTPAESRTARCVYDFGTVHRPVPPP